MICNVIDKDNYILKIYNKYAGFDIYEQENVKDFIKDIFNKMLKKYNLSGTIIFNIFIDRLYGMIIEVKKTSDLLIKKLIDIKIKFNLNISFLYEVDYFYLIDNNIVNQNVYFYNDKFYLEIINDVKEEDYIRLLDNSIIVYNDKINNIINNGIKLSIIKNMWYTYYKGDKYERNKGRKEV